MKKQLSIIVSLVLLAVFANFSRVNAQCTGTGLNPSAGTPYVYEVTVPTGTGYDGSGTYTWYITQNTDLLNAGAIIPETNTFFTVNSGAGLSAYNATTGTTNQLGITWAEAANTLTFYMVLRYSELNQNSGTVACNAENIRVWQITPNIATNFLLAITGAQPNGDPFADARQCAAAVIGAEITPGASPTVSYTYDVNTLYYLVTASGASGTWQPAIRLPNLAGTVAEGQVYGNVQWTDDLTGASPWNDFTGAAGTTGGDFTSANSAPVSTDGTPILIRVQIANNHYETLADQSINVGIDGLLPSGQSDIWGPGSWPGNPDECDQALPYAKTAIYTILARPDVQPVQPGAFITKLP